MNALPRSDSPPTDDLQEQRAGGRARRQARRHRVAEMNGDAAARLHAGIGNGAKRFQSMSAAVGEAMSVCEPPRLPEQVVVGAQFVVAFAGQDLPGVPPK